LRSIPTILPQSASPHWAIATTPQPFTVDQLPRGRRLAVLVADAGDASRAIASMAAPPASVSDLKYVDIVSKSVCSRRTAYRSTTVIRLHRFTSKELCLD
jgi:hypothetical protein